MKMKPGDGEAHASPSEASRRSTRPRGSSGRGRIAPQDLPIVERRRRALDTGMRMLAARERSEAEIRRALGRKGYDTDTIEVTLATLRSAGVLSDARFADAFAEDAGQRRGYSAAAVRMKLRAKGVSAEVAAGASASRPEEEYERAKATAMKRGRALASHPYEVRVRRLSGFLARRGYSADICIQIAREAAGSSDS